MNGALRWVIPTPFPVGGVNAWRIEGRRPALIDTGPRTPEAIQVLLDHVRRDPVRVVVITHEHVDHAGLAATLQRETGAEIVIHAREAATLQGWITKAAERERDYDAGLVAAGVPPDQLERMRYGGRKYDAWSEPVTADVTLQDGDEVDLGDSTFRVHDAPGHTVGSYLLSDGQQTFTGDTLLETITPNALSVRESERGALTTYLETLRRLKETDWGVLNPGHGASFRDAAPIIERALRHADVRQARILRELAHASASAYESAQRLFPRLAPNQLFLAVSEALGHLTHLERLGAVQRDRVDGVDRYRAVPNDYKPPQG